MTAPRSRRWLVAVAALAILYGGFEFGRWSAGYSVASSLTHRAGQTRRIGGLERQRTGLEGQLASAEIVRRVDREALTEAQRMIGELQAENARQQQELQFYRGLVTRQFGTGNLRVQELKIQSLPQQRQFQLQVTLVQAAARDAIASGTLTLAVDGTRGGGLVQLPLQQLEPAGLRELPFTLRYFQQLEVTVALPEGFSPASVQVEYRVGRAGDAPARQTFSWRVEGQSETPIL